MVLKFKLLQYDWFLKSGPYIWSITFILEFIRKQILKLYPTLVKSEMTEIGRHQLATNKSSKWLCYILKNYSHIKYEY
jgi:hypothetical protein